MAKIELTSGFTLIPEGIYIFKITTVNYKEEFGKLEVKMETENGLTHTEKFSLLNKDGSPNEGAYNAFSYFAKTALNDYERDSINHEELVGCFIECTVEHDIQPNKNKPGKTVTFVRLTDKNPADGYDGSNAPAPKSTAKPKTASAKKTVTKAEDIDLDDLLG